jgi:hypothetical protein
MREIAVGRHCRATGFAGPKSISFTPALVSMMVPGFTSRRTMPCPMRHIDRGDDPDGTAHRLRKRQRTAFEARRQRLASRGFLGKEG